MSRPLSIYCDTFGTGQVDDAVIEKAKNGIKTLLSIVFLAVALIAVTANARIVGELGVLDAGITGYDWIVENVDADDIVVTGDIPLAARCLDKDARVLGHKGRPFTTENVGEALASRHLLTQLREQGVMMGGPPPFAAKDRSLFLQQLDQMINTIQRD